MDEAGQLQEGGRPSNTVQRWDGRASAYRSHSDGGSTDSLRHEPSPAIEQRRAGEGPESAVDAIDFQAFLRVLWRRKFLFASVAALAMCVIAAVVVRMTPHYVAHALVAIGDPLVKSRLPYGGNQAAAIAAALPPDPGTVQTEVEVLKSPQLALQVIRDLKLANNPEFNPAAAPFKPSLVAQVKQRLLGTPPAPTPSDPAAELSQTIENFISRLRVNVKETSRMLDIGFDSTDPKLAMQITNALVDQYVDSQLEVRTQSAQRTSAWLRDRIAQLQAKVEDAEKAVERFRSQAGLFSTPGGSPLLLKQMTDVSAEFAAAQTARAALEAKLGYLRSAGARAGQEGSAADVATTPLMKTLDDQQADAQQKLAEALASVGEKHPIALGLREKIRRIQAAKHAEGVRAISSVESDLKVAHLKERDLGERLAGLQAQVADMNRSEITLRALERDAQADRLVLSNFIGRFKETSQESDAASQRPDARVVSYAQLPVNPDRPKRELLLAIAAVVSLIGGAVLVHVVERSNQTLRNGEDIERHLRVSALGMLPVCKAAALSPSEAARYGYHYREQLKAIYSRLYWSHTPPKITLVTSALPGEGKTTLALSLAAVAAQSGQRVIVVDADFWTMGTCEKLNIRSTTGLAELLEGKSSLSKAVVSHVVSGCDVLPPGHFSRASLLAWIGKLPAVLENLASQYDVIVVDAPPMLAAAEARLLVVHADATVLAVRYGSTPMETVRAALDELKEAGASLVGSVVTMAQVPAQASYSSGSYYPDRKQGRLMRSKYGQLPTAVTAQTQLPAVVTRRRNQTTAGRTRSWFRKHFGRHQALAPLALPSTAIPGGGKPEHGAGNCALLIMDMSDIHVTSERLGHIPTQTFETLIQTINAVARSALLAGMTIVYAQRSDRPAGRLARLVQGRNKRPQLVTRLKLVSGYSLLKVSEDAFSNPELDEFLSSHGIEHLFLAGLDGATSIAKTARSALDLGYKVSFIRDGIFTAFEPKWARLLDGFESNAAFAVTSEEFGDLRWRFAKRPQLNV